MNYHPALAGTPPEEGNSATLADASLKVGNGETLANASLNTGNAKTLVSVPPEERNKVSRLSLNKFPSFGGVAGEA